MALFQHMTRLVAMALLAVGLTATLATTASAQDRVEMSIVSGGVIIGGTGGSGVLIHNGQRYPLRIGGISAGFTLGFQGADVVGTVHNLSRPQDIEGTYAAARASGTLGAGAAVVSMTNGKGVTLNLRMVQIGLGYSLDLGGMNIVLR